MALLVEDTPGAGLTQSPLRSWNPSAHWIHCCKELNVTQLRLISIQIANQSQYTYPVMHFKHFKLTESNRSQFNDLNDVPTHLPF